MHNETSTKYHLCKIHMQTDRGTHTLAYTSSDTDNGWSFIPATTWMGLCRVQVAICRLSGSRAWPSRVIVKPFTPLSPPQTRWFIVIAANVHLADGWTSLDGSLALRHVFNLFMCVLRALPNSDGSNNYNNHHNSPNNRLFRRRVHQVLQSAERHWISTTLSHCKETFDIKKS